MKLPQGRFGELLGVKQAMVSSVEAGGRLFGVAPAVRLHRLSGGKLSGLELVRPELRPQVAELLRDNRKRGRAAVSV